ncbi:hypothetical protein JRO89_XS08G0059500 [Xanthoceras sorbifolium]|uniref:Uncharacterized protein n=1 Tax=Xanthoceras sorbifolium TaxID=99658 RepID=A0ABQ8HNR8_9ROSI|nr:hypothetical protein JRO89_XS08G0059500 [Xanthoceras sorbifolium]
MKVVTAYLLAILGGKAKYNRAYCIWAGETGLSALCGGGALAMATSASAGGAPTAPAAESKKEEKVEEKEESDDFRFYGITLHDCPSGYGLQSL